MIDSHQQANRAGDATNAPAHDTEEVTSMPENLTETELFTFRVEGVEQPTTYLTKAPQDRPFDETFTIEGEHPADALDKLVHEIEWGILDSYSGFTITVLPSERDDDA